VRRTMSDAPISSAVEPSSLPDWGSLSDSLQQVFTLAADHAAQRAAGEPDSSSADGAAVVTPLDLVFGLLQTPSEADAASLLDELARFLGLTPAVVSGRLTLLETRAIAQPQSEGSPR
jgi:hypothetical protein